MERTIKTWRDPYDRGFSTTKKKSVTIKSGLTVLVGCNGAGKSTLLRNIKSELKEQSIPCMFYDNQLEGHHSRTFGPAIEQGNIGFVATALQSSEGENISINLNVLAENLRDFIETGETSNDRRDREWEALFNKVVTGPVESKERWILLDAVDSGYSIDNVVELKGFFDSLIEYITSKDLVPFIVISANEFELAYQTPCFDVISGKYCDRFDTYDSFREFILKSAELKCERELNDKN